MHKGYVCIGNIERMSLYSLQSDLAITDIIDHGSGRVLKWRFDSSHLLRSAFIGSSYSGVILVLEGDIHPNKDQ